MRELVTWLIVRAEITHTAQGKRAGHAGSAIRGRHRRGWPLLAPDLRGQQTPRATLRDLRAEPPWNEGIISRRSTWMCISGLVSVLWSDATLR